MFSLLGSYFTGNLKSILWAGFLAVVLSGAGYVYHLKSSLKVALAENATLGLRLQVETDKLSLLGIQRVKLEGDLKAAQEKSQKVKVITQTRVKTILKEAPPVTCEDARKYLIDAAREDQ